MTSVLRFPHIPHLAWLGQGQPRDDKVLSRQEAEGLLDGEVVVEEKVDGANIGFSTTEGGELRVQSRGTYLDREHGHPQFGPLSSWMAARGSELVDALWPDRVLFGEWCHAVHSVAYDRLPDWFLGFDIYDGAAAMFWDTVRRNDLLKDLRLHPVPHLGSGRFSMPAVVTFLSGRSRVGAGPLEGLVVRKESGGFTTARAKLVRPEFTQAIDEHWSRGPLRRNKLAEGAIPWP